MSQLVLGLVRLVSSHISLALSSNSSSSSTRKFLSLEGPLFHGSVFGVFLAQKLAGKPLTIVGDGSQTRDFTYVSDVVEAFVTASKSSVSGEIFNVGSGGTYSVNELVKLIGGEVTHMPKRPGEPDQTFADISKIREILGWTPKVPFAEGVGKVLEHIDDWGDAPVWTPEKISEATRSWFESLEEKPVDV